MVCCALFGHHDSPDYIRPVLRQKICSVLEVEPDCCFLVGNQGRFDALALSVFKELEHQGGSIDYSVVLAYLPEDKSKLPAASEHTLYPEGIETVPKRFAISWRNKCKRSTIRTLRHEKTAATIFGNCGLHIQFFLHSFGSVSAQGSSSSRKSRSVSSICFGISVKRCFRYS